MSDQSASNRIYSDAQLSDEVAVAGTPGFTSVTAMNLKTAGANTVNEKFTVDLAGLQPAIAGNDATLDCTITGADSGTSGTADVFLHGYFIE